MPYAAPSAKPPRANLFKRQERKLYDIKRGTANERGYDSAWRKVRLQHLADSPLCMDCLKEGRYAAASDVHHVLKLQDHPELRDVSANLMSLCHRCHSCRTSKGE